MFTPLCLLANTCLIVAAAARAEFIVGIGHWKDRRDYRETVSRWIQETGAKPQIHNLGDTNLTALDSFWGIHIRNETEYARFASWQVVNSIPGARELWGDKDGIATLQRCARKELLGNGEFSPQAYILPRDLPEFLARGNPNEVFVRKRLNSHSGAGIKIMRAREIAKQGLDAGKEEFVVQKYVLDVMLVDQHKFDVRWWAVLILSNNNDSRRIRAYLFHDGYAKIACSGGAYDPHNISNKCAHITNTAVQRACEKSSSANALGGGGICAQPETPRNVRSNEFQQHIAGNATILFEGAKRILEQVLRVSAYKLDLLVQRSKAKCGMFQLLAMDVIYERGNNHQAWLLEINLNGYLQSGLLKVPNAEQRFVEMLQHVGLLPCANAKQVCDARAAAPSLHPDWVELEF